ncbi:hypothetical protein ACWEVY_28780 [Streptomyces longwoodensis]
MSWRYDVFECGNETDDHAKCEAMSGPPKECFWDARWKDAYRLAASLPHGVVESRYVGDQDYGRTPHVVFEHIDGGGICWLCREGRGPLCRTADGNRFLCDRCQKSRRQEHEQSARQRRWEPNRWLYVPIIETVDWEAQ